MRRNTVLVRAPRLPEIRLTVPDGYVICLECLTERPKSDRCIKCFSDSFAEPVQVEQESRS